MGKYKIIKFGKQGCAPCENVERYLNSKNIVFESIDVTNEDDETLELCSKYGIGMSIPKTLLIDANNGEMLEIKNGFNPTALDSIIDKFNSES